MMRLYKYLNLVSLAIMGVSALASYFELPPDSAKTKQ